MAVILVTGANGYLGGKLPGDLAWVRARSEAEARARLPGFSGEVAFGELTDEDAFAGVDPDRITAIVHAAAVTRFNVDAATATAVNVEGAQRLFAFAERCKRLQNLIYVSTVYSAGLREGEVAEELHAAAGFANQYERSKWQAERLLAEKYPHLPWRIARVATVVSDDESGRVVQKNAVHNTLRLLFYGLLSLVPGRSQTPLHFVTGDFVADAISRLLQDSQPHGVYHLAHSEACTLGELVELAFAAFAEDDNFRARRILPPLFVDAESFELLAHGTEGFGGEVTRQALASVAPFARQLFSPKRFDNARLKAVMPSYRAPEPRRLVQSFCRELVQTRWGRA